MPNGYRACPKSCGDSRRLRNGGFCRRHSRYPLGKSLTSTILTMDDSEKQFLDQSRSNTYAREILSDWEARKPELLVDPKKFTPQKKAVIKELGNVKNKNILEFGCGNGLYSIALSKLGADVTGLDAGKDIIRLARKAAALNGVSCNFLVGNMASVPLANGAFDYVIGHGVLHHLPPSWLKRSIHEAHRVLRPKGKAYFSEPVENSRIFNFIQNIVPINSPDSPQTRPSILQRKKWKVYSRTVDDRGFTNQELIEAKGFFEEVTIDYYGFLIRLARLHWGSRFAKIWENVDVALTSRFSPVKKLSQCVLVRYSKNM